MKLIAAVLIAALPFAGFAVGLIHGSRTSEDRSETAEQATQKKDAAMILGYYYDATEYITVCGGEVDTPPPATLASEYGAWAKPGFINWVYGAQTKETARIDTRLDIDYGSGTDKWPCDPKTVADTSATMEYLVDQFREAISKPLD